MKYTFQELIQDTAKELAISEDIVAKVLRHEGDWVADILRRKKHAAVFFQGLGTFESNPITLRNAIKSISERPELTKSDEEKLESYLAFKEIVDTYHQNKKRKK